MTEKKLGLFKLSFYVLNIQHELWKKIWWEYFLRFPSSAPCHSIHLLVTETPGGDHSNTQMENYEKSMTFQNSHQSMQQKFF